MIIDDHPIIHDGLRTLLSVEPDLEVVDSAMSSSEALKLLARSVPDLAIIDLSLGDSAGTLLIKQIHQLYKNLPILVYTMSEERLYAERVAIAGARGYVMKTSSPKELRLAIRAALEGNLFFNPDILERIRQKSRGEENHDHSLLDELSDREMSIFHLLGQGLNSADIGEKLGISSNTVDTHRINMKNKLGLPNGRALLELAHDVIRNGMSID
ncbi:MAG TPA: response regulator transcription factor [Nitrospiria bacterium]|nr:response regulator transcription factor [Nitrospiria bacterium]